MRNDFTYPENDILFDIEQTLPKKVINGITEAVKTLLGNTEELQGVDKYGQYSRKFKYKTPNSVITVEIGFNRTADIGEWKGFHILLSGECTDGKKIYSLSDVTCLGPYEDGSMNALVKLLEDYQPTDWCYAQVCQFADYLLENLEELGEPVAEIA